MIIHVMLYTTLYIFLQLMTKRESMKNFGLLKDKATPKYSGSSVHNSCEYIDKVR